MSNSTLTRAIRDGKRLSVEPVTAERKHENNNLDQLVMLLARSTTIED